MPEAKIGFAAALEHHANRVEHDYAKAQMEAAKDFISSFYEKATAYENIIIIGGYAAFFSLWSGVSHDIERAAALWAVGLMSISLLAYVSFHVLQMVTRSLAQFSVMRDLSAEASPENAARALEAFGKPTPGMTLVLRIWPVIMIVCLGTGLPAAILVGCNAVASAMGFYGWPR